MTKNPEQENTLSFIRTLSLNYLYILKFAMERDLEIINAEIKQREHT